MTADRRLIQTPKCTRCGGQVLLTPEGAVCARGRWGSGPCSKKTEKGG